LVPLLRDGSMLWWADFLLFKRIWLSPSWRWSY